MSNSKMLEDEEVGVDIDDLLSESDSCDSNSS